MTTGPYPHPRLVSFIEARNQIAYYAFHTSGISKVVIGKHDWLFCNDDEAGTAQLNRKKLSDYELESWARQQEARQDFLNSHNIKFVFVIAPEKGSIYPEMMPDNWKRSIGTSRLEQLQEYLLAHTHVDFIDARSILLDAKQHDAMVYLPRDAHWNPYGAFLVSQELLKHLNLTMPHIKPLKPSEFHLAAGYLPADLAEMLGLGENLRDDCRVVVPTEARAQTVRTKGPDLPQLSGIGASFEVRTNNNNLPKALVLRDSFCGFLAPFLSTHFSSTQYHWTNSFSPQVILDQHPNVVVNELAERFLYHGNCDHVPRFMSEPYKEHALCSFGSEVNLENLTAKKTSTGLLLTLVWQTQRPTTLDYNVAIHTLDSEDKNIGGGDYAPDFLQRHVRKGTAWIDTIELPNEQLRNASRLGFTLYRKGQNSMVCLVRNKEEGSCYEIGLDQITDNTKHISMSDSCDELVKYGAAAPSTN